MLDRYTCNPVIAAQDVLPNRAGPVQKHACFVYCEVLPLRLSTYCHVCSAVIAVGYMFRYSALAQTAKKILQEHNAKPLCVIARYACGYSDIQKKDW